MLAAVIRQFSDPPDRAGVHFQLDESACAIVPADDVRELNSSGHGGASAKQWCRATYGSGPARSLATRPRLTPSIRWF